jgi:hypothetical protein
MLGSIPIASLASIFRNIIVIDYLVSIRKLRMGNYWFPIRKGEIICPGKKIKGLRGGVHRYAAQASTKIDAAWAKKNPFRTETI